MNRALVLGGSAAAGVVFLLWKRAQKQTALADVPVITSFDDPRLAWDQGPPREMSISEDGELRVSPTPGLDYWSRTFYTPLLVKHDAQTLLAEVGANIEATLTTAFTLTPKAQFDQAGIMIKVDELSWVKAGIEFTDGVPRLSCVVTNDGFSDWSTQAWRQSTLVPGTTSIRVRVSKLLPGAAQGPALVMEACAYNEGDNAQSDGEWVQVRIASLRSSGKPWRMGIFAICPVANEGCTVQFHHLTLGPKCEPVHKADNPLDG
mmetsp:Transcript_52954/g.113520  ORF Transcript_52954/g.113520 Transcript_52954/m.113520 type:complete len:262 (+) Transcript_52954:137-922(+)